MQRDVCFWCYVPLPLWYRGQTTKFRLALNPLADLETSVRFNWVIVGWGTTKCVA